MKRGHLAIALFLFGMIAIIGIVGFLFLTNDTPSGAYAGYYGYQSSYQPKPNVLVGGRYPISEAYGITYDLYLAETDCPHRSIYKGGWQLPGMRATREQFQCFVVPFSVFPLEYTLKLRNAAGPYYNWWPVVCFFQGERPEGYDYPLLCKAETQYPFIPQ